MGVKLSDFCRALMIERKIIRKNMGSSIVPLMIIKFEKTRYLNGYGEYDHVPHQMLLTICRKTGVVFSQTDLSKLYSAGGGTSYREWWARSEVVSVSRPPVISGSKLIIAHIQFDEEMAVNHEQTW